MEIKETDQQTMTKAADTGDESMKTESEKHAEDQHINESILSEAILEDQKKNRIDHMKYMPGMEDIGFSGTSVSGSASISGRDRSGRENRNKKTFWKQCVYVYTDLHCKLL